MFGFAFNDLPGLHKVWPCSLAHLHVLIPRSWNANPKLAAAASPKLGNCGQHWRPLLFVLQELESGSGAGDDCCSDVSDNGDAFTCRFLDTQRTHRNGVANMGSIFGRIRTSFAPLRETWIAESTIVIRHHQR